jgi:hypothetical protein
MVLVIIVLSLRFYYLIIALKLSRVFLNQRFESDGNFWIILKSKHGLS